MTSLTFKEQNQTRRPKFALFPAGCKADIKPDVHKVEFLVMVPNVGIIPLNRKSN